MEKTFVYLSHSLEDLRAMCQHCLNSGVDFVIDSSITAEEYLGGIAIIIRQKAREQMSSSIIFHIYKTLSLSLSLRLTQAIVDI